MSLISSNPASLVPVSGATSAPTYHFLTATTVTSVFNITEADVILTGELQSDIFSIQYTGMSGALVQTNVLQYVDIDPVLFSYETTDYPLAQIHALIGEPSTIVFDVSYGEIFFFWHALISEGPVTFFFDVTTDVGVFAFTHALVADVFEYTYKGNLEASLQQTQILSVDGAIIQSVIPEFYLTQNLFGSSGVPAPASAPAANFPFKCLSPKSRVTVRGGTRMEFSYTGNPTQINWQCELHYEITLVLESLTPQVAAQLVGFCSSHLDDYFEFTCGIDGFHYAALLDNLPTLRPISGGFYYDTTIKLDGIRV